jgi:hypothetical protein
LVCHINSGKGACICRRLGAVIPIGLLKRAENEELPLLGIRAIRELRSILDRLEREHIMSARDKGASWADIAASVGITRQALQQRMGSAAHKADRSTRKAGAAGPR